MSKRLTRINPIEEARGASRFPKNPLNIGLKKLAEHDRQLWEARQVTA